MSPIPLKNEPTVKYKKAFEILNNMNNNKYTMKYLEENKLKNKYSEGENSSKNLVNYNNKNSSYIKKESNSLKDEKKIKGRNKSTKEYNRHISKSNNEEKENNNINEYKINSLNSSYNNNFTNIKTNKIVFIDVKNNTNHNSNSNNDTNNANSNNNKINFNDRYIKNLINNESDNNNNNNTNMNEKTSKNRASSLKNSKMNTNDKNHHSKNKNISWNSQNNVEENKNNKSNNKFSNLVIQKLSKSRNNFSVYVDKKNSVKKKMVKHKDLQEIKKNNKLTQKECSYYILSKSPVLRFYQRMMFARSTPTLKKIIQKDTVFKDQKDFLEDKINELKQKMVLCNIILNKPFVASKTADITLNFITSLHEIEFKEFPILMASDEEKKYYVNYIKILYYLLNEEFENCDDEPDMLDKNNIKALRRDLYLKINKKGYKSIRDYLYSFYIKNKDTIKEIPKIVEINYLVSQVENMFETHTSLKICKFISFTTYLIRELINFGNNINSSVELLIKAKNMNDIVIKKLENIENKCKNKDKDKNN